MSLCFEKYKGIHPGIVLERELNKRSLRQSPFASSIGTQRQTFNAIIKGKRGIPLRMALKIEKELHLEEGSIVLLQTYYDIKKEKEHLQYDMPDLKLFRKSLFWDTDINHINWDQQAGAVIRRVYEKGNNIEMQELLRFYGEKKVNDALKAKRTKPMQLHHKL